MPVGTIPTLPGGGAGSPPIGNVPEVELLDKNGKVVGTEKLPTTKPKLRPMTRRQRLVLILIVLVSGFYAAMAIYSWMLH